MSAQISLNPSLASNASGTFGIDWNGLIAGFTMPDPSSRYWLSGGWLAASETLPMFGGLGISEAVPTPQGSPPLTPSQSLGGPIIRATKIAAGVGTLTGFSVFDQNYSAVNSPQSEVPQVGTYGAVHFCRFGTNARIAVACAPGLSSYEGDPINQPVSWDFAAQMLVPYAPAFAAAVVSGATWANTSGGQTTFTVNVDYTALLSAGSIIDVSGVVNTGGISTSAFNGQFVVVSVPDPTHVVVTQLAAASPGTYASGGAIAAGGGAVPCRILKLEFGNSMVPFYNPVTNFINWNRSGSAAVILI